MTERKGIIRLLGRMFAEPNSDLMETQSELWQSYLGRYHDIDTGIRVMCIEQAENILINHPSSKAAISEHWNRRHRDADDNVRCAVVSIFYHIVDVLEEENSHALVVKGAGVGAGDQGLNILNVVVVLGKAFSFKILLWHFIKPSNAVSLVGDSLTIPKREKIDIGIKRAEVKLAS